MFSKLDKLLKQAKKAGAEAEIIFRKSKNTALEVENSKIKEINKINTEKVAVKVFLNKRKGVAVSTILDKDIMQRAIDIAKNSEKEEYYYGLPKKQKYSEVKGLNNKMPSEEKLMEMAKKSIKIITDKKQGTSISDARFSSSENESFLVSTNGIKKSGKGSMFSLDIEVIAKKGKNAVQHSDSICSRKVSDITKFSKDLKKESLELLNKKQLKEKIDIIIIHPELMANLLDSAFLENFKAEDIIKKRSLLTDKLNKKVFSDKITLTDNGKLQGGVSSSKCDSEGTISQETCLIKKGVIKNFVNDYNSAKKLKVKPTGNSNFDGIDFNNIIIEPGKEDIFKKIDKALIVKSALGVHTSNPITTAFSIKTDAAFLYKNGKKQAIDDVMLSGKVSDILKNIVAIDKKQINFYNFYLPLIAVKGITITSQKK